MNRREAKTILEVYRSGGQDANDPQFAGALELAARDPELGRWFAEQKSFDAAVVASVKAIPAPSELRESVLAERKVVEVPVWRRWPARLAAAAAVLILVTLSGIWLAGKPASFAHYREEIVESSWDASRHLDLVSSDLTQVRQWLTQQNASADFALPPGLADARVQGCRVLEWNGRKVSFVCLLDGMKHLHLFVTDPRDFSDLPSPRSPQFEETAGWKTASWCQGGKAYVLSGMKYSTFVKRFRKFGQWVFAG